jgi:hypothetical protein
LKKEEEKIFKNTHQEKKVKEAHTQTHVSLSLFVFLLFFFFFFFFFFRLREREINPFSRLSSLFFPYMYTRVHMCAGVRRSRESTHMRVCFRTRAWYV